MIGFRWRAICPAAALALLLPLSPAGAGETMQGANNPVTFSGTLWAAYQYILEDMSPGDQAKDSNRFFIDRVYLTFASKLGERYTGRARVEMQNLNDGSADIFLKTADLLVAEPFGLKNMGLRFGQTSDLISSFLEGPWGYRVVSRTTTDRYLGVSTSYIGAGVSNRFAGGRVETDALLANRVGYSRDADGADAKYKLFGGRVYMKPVPEGGAEGLGIGTYAQIAPDRSPSADNRSLWYGGHVFFETKIVERPFLAGAQIDLRQTKTDGDAVTSRVISLLARGFASERIEIFGRVDLVDFDTDRDEASRLADAARTALIAGLSRAYSNSLRSIVDVEIVSISDDVAGIDPETEIIISARLDAKL